MGRERKLEVVHSIGKNGSHDILDVLLRASHCVAGSTANVHQFYVLQLLIDHTLADETREDQTMTQQFYVVHRWGAVRAKVSANVRELHLRRPLICLGSRFIGSECKRWQGSHNGTRDVDQRTKNFHG